MLQKSAKHFKFYAINIRTHDPRIGKPHHTESSTTQE